jgi:four helix bundle protein
MPARFDHEKLTVYRRSLEFVAWAAGLMARLPARHAVQGQLDRAATSIPLNIAESNGRFTSADRCRFFDIARGSALECAAALDVLVARKILTEAEVDRDKALLGEIVAMLVGLIRSNSETRLHEDSVPYRVADGQTTC